MKVILQAHKFYFITEIQYLEVVVAATNMTLLHIETIYYKTCKKWRNKQNSVIENRSLKKVSFLLAYRSNWINDSVRKESKL